MVLLSPRHGKSFKDNLEYTSKLVRDLSPVEYYKINKLCQSGFGYDFYANEMDTVILGYHVNAGALMCVCCISRNSIFYESSGHVSVPYIYNFVIDLRYREHKISLHLMNYVKEFISIHYAAPAIELHTTVKNARAQLFYEKNGFKSRGSEFHEGILYIKYVYQYPNSHNYQTTAGETGA